MCRTKTRGAVCFLASLGFVVLGGDTARGAAVAWTVDSTASYVRLSIADQVIDAGGTPVTIRISDVTSTTNWTDAGGRRAFLTGQLATDFTPGASIEFLSGQHALEAIDDKALRPNFANWDSKLGAYVGTSAAPAAYGGRILGIISSAPNEVGPFAIRDVGFDIAGGALALDGGGAFSGSGTTFAFTSGQVGLDVTTIILAIVPDYLQPLTGMSGLNSGGGTVTDLGGGNFKLTYNVDTPLNFAFEDLGNYQATATGQIVAYAYAVPEPASAVLLAVGGLAACAGARRMRRPTESP